MRVGILTQQYFKPAAQESSGFCPFRHPKLAIHLEVLLFSFQGLSPLHLSAGASRVWAALGVFALTSVTISSVSSLDLCADRGQSI